MQTSSIVIKTIDTESITNSLELDMSNTSLNYISDNDNNPYNSNKIPIVSNPDYVITGTTMLHDSKFTIDNKYDFTKLSNLIRLHKRSVVFKVLMEHGNALLFEYDNTILNSEGDTLSYKYKSIQSQESNSITYSFITVPSTDISDVTEFKIDSITIRENQPPPVGGIYISVSATDPNNIFIGTTWEAIQGKFLLSADDTYVAGTTGGEATHTLSISEMPAHTHTQAAHTHTQAAHTHTLRFKYFAIKAGDSSQYAILRRWLQGDGYDGTNNAASSQTPAIYSATAVNNNTGGSSAHNNMPPYLSVYMWKRIS